MAQQIIGSLSKHHRSRTKVYEIKLNWKKITLKRNKQLGDLFNNSITRNKN